MTPGGPLLLPGADLRATADQVADAVSGRYGLALGPARTVTRTRLDTVDLRLADRGLRLLLEESGQDRRLVLSRRDGRTLSVDATGFSPPALVDAVPAGRLRETVRKPLSVRALLPQEVERRRAQSLAVRESDGTTVVRVDVDAPEHGPPTLVTVEALPGHQHDADRVLALLARLPGAAVASTPPLPRAAAPPPPTFGSSTPAPQAVAELVAGYLAEMRATVEGVIADVDTEFLHEFRVALRRTRTLLKLSRRVLDPATVARRERDAKRLGDLTTHLRDLDVHLLGLPRMRRWLVSADPHDLEPFERHLRRRRADEHRRLARAATTARTRRLLAGDWTAELVRTASAAQTAVTADELSRRSISRAHRRVLATGSAVTAQSPAEDLHTVRRRCKDLRYALEMFSPLHDPQVTKKTVSDLKRLQDCLGRFQDAQVQQAAVRRYADEMASDAAPAPALLAMGELAAHLEADHATARSDFAAAFARFARSSTTARLRSLGTGGSS